MNTKIQLFTIISLTLGQIVFTKPMENGSTIKLNLNPVQIAVSSIIKIGALKYSKTVQTIYDLLPEDEKQPFISYFLMKEYWGGLPKLPLSSAHEYPFMPDLHMKFESLDVPSDFPYSLTKWVKDQFKVEKDQIPILCRGEIVCPSELDHCIDLGDVGSICCPF